MVLGVFQNLLYNKHIDSNSAVYNTHRKTAMTRQELIRNDLFDACQEVFAKYGFEWGNEEWCLDQCSTLADSVIEIEDFHKDDTVEA